MRCSMRIWIDADACPRMIRAFIFKTSTRLQVPVTLVANNGLDVPRSPLVHMIVVGREIDAADAYIVEHSAPGDLVVTADIPLAAALVDKGVPAINPRGLVYTPDNVSEALATRDLMQQLRETGVMEGGPPAMEATDASKFANALDRELTRLLRKRG